MKIKLLVALGFLSIVCFGFPPKEYSKKVQTVLSRHTVIYDKVPTRIPSRVAVDAPLLGNGYTAIALSGNPEKQIFRVARNDFWRFKSALDESYPTVLGKIILNVPQLEGASYQAIQDLFTATTTVTLSKGKTKLVYKAYVSAVDDVLVVEMTLQGDSSIEATVNLELPGADEIVNQPPLERVFPDEKGIKTEKEIETLWRGFEKDVDQKTIASIALRILQQNRNGKITLKPNQTVRFVCAFSSNFKSEDCVKSVNSKVSAISEKETKTIQAKHQNWWKTYWEKSFVDIQQFPEIEKQYYISLYGLASCSRDKDFPPSIFGSWITKERPDWNGDYHLNYNHEAPYYGLYSSNRIEQADPYYAPLLAIIPQGNLFSEKITGIKDGILLPVGIGPLNTDTVHQSPFLEQYFASWINNQTVEGGSCFWGQKSNAAYATVDISMQFYHTWDRAFTEKVYPFVFGVAKFWSEYLKFEDGRYVIYNDAIHEGTNGTKNPILSLGLVPMVMKTAIDMSTLLGKNEQERAKWQDIINKMSTYTFQEKNNKTVFRYSEKGTDWWDGNTLGIQHIYPAGQIGIYSDPKLLEISKNTIEVMGDRWFDSNGSNSFFPAAVRIGYDPEIILEKMKQYCLDMYPNGFRRGNPHGIENWSTVPNTINEMLCTGHQDVVRVFEGWNKKEDAEFGNIRVEGAFLVSSKLIKGEVQTVTIVSEQGRPLAFLNPWKAKKVSIKSNGKTQILSGEFIKMNTEKGVVYTINCVL
ncbi:glycosyl hydrolase family 95 catalytic domain-containing protein [Flavobacterium granuli]|uniref:Glycosyl hydrolase family 95 catalytic domain-containing protein n=1 Tax=Flavobacterium granuli TaxID=280093 RepID=A0ABU1S0X8_9FLAO|nr:hypothetical protein [Flavobacterium granuli]MDR6844681.1 hypothetical protein [Flavobacterium granuli]